MIRPYLKKAGVLAIAELLARAKGVIILPLLTHRLGAVGYGAWSQVVVLVTLLVPVIMLGTDSGIVRYLPGTDREERTRRFVGWMLAITIVTAALCGLVALFRNPVATVLFGARGDYARFVPLAAASVGATVALNFSRIWFRLENSAIGLSCITLGQALLSTVAFVGWYLAGKHTYQFVLYTILADAVLAVLMLLFIVQRTGIVRPDFSILPLALRFGLWMLPAGYAVWALNWADRLILVSYASLRDIGIYSLAYNLGYLVIQVVVNPIWTMFPNTASELWNRGERRQLQRLFEKTAGLMLALVLPAIAGGAVLGEGLLRLVAPPSFAAAAPVLPLVLAGYLLFMLSAYYEVSFGYVGRQALGALTVAVACGVNLGLNFLLVPRYTYIGAAVATCLAFAVELLLCLGLAHRLETLQTPWRGPARMVLAALLMAAALLPFRSAFIGHGALWLTVGVVYGSAVYAIMCVILGLVKAGTVVDEVCRILRRRPIGTSGA